MLEPGESEVMEPKGPNGLRTAGTGPEAGTDEPEVLEPGESEVLGSTSSKCWGPRQAYEVCQPSPWRPWPSHVD